MDRVFVTGLSERQHQGTLKKVHGVGENGLMIPVGVVLMEEYRSEERGFLNVPYIWPCEPCVGDQFSMHVYWDRSNSTTQKRFEIVRREIIPMQNQAYMDWREQTQLEPLIYLHVVPLDNNEKEPLDVLQHRWVCPNCGQTKEVKSLGEMMWYKDTKECTCGSALVRCERKPEIIELEGRDDA